MNEEIDVPEPQVDPPPPSGPGGPDAVGTWEGVHEDEPDTPDQPVSAQVEEESVPDEIQQPEETDAGDADDDAAQDPGQETQA